MVNVVTRKEFKKEIKEFKKEIKSIKDLIKRLQKNVKKFQNPMCPYCGSRDVIRHGLRKNQSKKTVQRFGCNVCSYKFSQFDFLDYRMRNDRPIIEKALKLRREGKTLAQISNEIKVVSRQTIKRWLDKFQPPTKEKIVNLKIKNKNGKDYNRNFKIKI